MTTKLSVNKLAHVTFGAYKTIWAAVVRVARLRETDPGPLKTDPGVLKVLKPRNFRGGRAPAGRGFFVTIAAQRRFFYDSPLDDSIAQQRIA